MKRKNYLYSTWVTILVLIPIFTFAQLTVGEYVSIQYESPHPYPAATQPSEIVWTQEISYTEKTATYIAVHFNQLDISAGDILILRSPDNKRRWEYTNADNTRGEIWSIPIYGDKAILEIVSNPGNSSFGYYIDKIARGFTEEEVYAFNTMAICGEDDSQEAKCYMDSELEVYNHSKAVARLVIDGITRCTGWLIGDEGHLMTNNHCINSEASANNTFVEMMAEGESCDVNCADQDACDQTPVTDHLDFIKTSEHYDYCLVQLPEEVRAEVVDLGYLKMRETGTYLYEQVYIPQHPAGWGKRIALASDHPKDVVDGLIHVQNFIQDGFNSERIESHGDSQGGSSGSPFISYDDHYVVGLLNTSTEEPDCKTLAIHVPDIIKDLGDLLPASAISDGLLNSGLVRRVGFDLEKEIFLFDPFENVKIGINKDNGEACPEITDENGFYNFADCDFSTAIEKVTYFPKGDENEYDPFQIVFSPTNGVTTFDLIKIRRHILQTEVLPSPYGIIAADANNSGDITLLDFIEIKKVILGIEENFTVDSWRFVPNFAFDRDFFVFGCPTDDPFGNPCKPFEENPFEAKWHLAPYGSRYYLAGDTKSYLEEVDMELSNEDFTELNSWSFFGIKTGDVNFSASLSEEAPPGTPGFSISSDPHNCIQSGESFTISFIIESSNALIDAYQMELAYDINSLDLTGVNQGSVTPFKLDNFNLNREGELLTLWIDETGNDHIEVAGEKTLFKIFATAKNNICNISEVFQFNNRTLKNLFWGLEEEEITGLNFKMEVEQSNIRNILKNVYPNPASNQVVFDFETQDPTQIDITIFDQFGNSFNHSAYYAFPGLITYAVNDLSGLQDGMLTYNVIIGTESFTGNFLKMQ